MRMPSALQGESLTRLSQGLALGAIATMAAGFGYGGWTLGSTARTQAEASARAAVVAAVAPICADQFQKSVDAAAKLAELKKANSWEQATFVEKGGWAIMPGAKEASVGVPQACATLITSVK